MMIMKKIQEQDGFSFYLLWPQSQADLRVFKATEANRFKMLDFPLDHGPSMYAFFLKS